MVSTAARRCQPVIEAPGEATTSLAAIRLDRARFLPVHRGHLSVIGEPIPSASVTGAVGSGHRQRCPVEQVDRSASSRSAARRPAVAHFPCGYGNAVVVALKVGTVIIVPSAATTPAPATPTLTRGCEQQRSSLKRPRPRASTEQVDRPQLFSTAVTFRQERTIRQHRSNWCIHRKERPARRQLSTPPAATPTS